MALLLNIEMYILNADETPDLTTNNWETKLGMH
jgi:hypothetical protein